MYNLRVDVSNLHLVHECITDIVNLTAANATLHKFMLIKNPLFQRKHDNKHVYSLYIHYVQGAGSDSGIFLKLAKSFLMKLRDILKQL